MKMQGDCNSQFLLGEHIPGRTWKSLAVGVLHELQVWVYYVLSVCSIQNCFIKQPFIL